jgi:hypothetical protein
MLKNLASFFVLSAATFCALSSNSAKAELELLPDSHHQLFEAFVWFADEQFNLSFQGDAGLGQRLWTGAGGVIPLIGNEESPYKPQVVFHASANAATHLDGNLRFYTETFDARFGVYFDVQITENLRGFIGLTHNSGHAADGMNAADVANGQGALFVTPVGEEFIPVRVIYDYQKMFRFGVEFKPFIRSAPQMTTLAFDQWIEYFPLGATDNPHWITPYISIGMDQEGPVNYFSNRIEAQLGVYIGSHFSEVHKSTIRFLVGYYNGLDPRFKYQQVADSNAVFFYGGTMINL